MWIFILLLAVLLGMVLWTRRKGRRTVLDLAEAVRMRQPFLLEERHAGLTADGLETLVGEVNGLIHDWEEQRIAGAGRLEQLKKLFHHMREAVLVLDEQKRILFSNPTSQQLFRLGESLTNRRVEAVVHSSKFVHMLQEVRDGKEARNSGEIEIISERRTRWFEVSITALRPSRPDESQLTLALFHDITRLKELERIRRDFVANVSHELRTPITVMKGFSEALIDPEARLSEDQRQTFLKKIHRHSVRLSALVEDLLVLSRIESEGLQRRREIGRLSTMVQNFVDSYPVEVGDQGIRIETDLAAEEPEFPFDPSQILQVLHNLVDNALRYGESLSFVRIITRPAGDGHFELAVLDDGVGIPERERERVFERFYRMEKGRHRDHGGTGLGLSIVRNAVLQHGGRVWAEGGPAKGTCVRCLFPTVAHDAIHPAKGPYPTGR